MSRKTVLIVTLTVLCAFVCGAVAAQRDFSAVEMKTHTVAGNVSMLEGAGGNIGVSAGDDGILIIDDQFAGLAEKIKTALGQISTGELQYVLNTHYHGDHTGSNAIFGLEAVIVAHDNVRARLSTEQSIRGQTVPPQPPEAWPVITFNDEMSIYFNGERLGLYHLPSGHTDGDSAIYFFESNVLHMGDHFFRDRFPFVDIAGGGSATGLAANIKMVLGNIPDDVKIIPGHGALSTKEDLERYSEMLEDCIATVKKGIDDGKTLEQIQETGFSDRWEGWGSGFINAGAFAQFIHASLTQ